MPNSSLEPPTLSEVIRRLDSLSNDLKEMGGRVVSMEVYLLDKAVHDREIKDMRERLVTQEKESDAREIRVQDQAAKNRQFLIGIIASPFAAALVAWITAGGVRP